MFRVRYLDMDGNTHTMWVNDSDSEFLIEWHPTRPLSIGEIDGLLSAQVYWIRERHDPHNPHRRNVHRGSPPTQTATLPSTLRDSARDW